MEESCHNCAFFFPIVPDPEWVERAWGECRALPPRAEQGVVGCWPIIVANDWCGKWEKRKRELPEPVSYDCREIAVRKTSSSGKKTFCGFHQTEEKK